MDKNQFTGKVWVRRASNVFRGRTMASRVPDSPPDWLWLFPRLTRLPILPPTFLPLQVLLLQVRRLPMFPSRFYASKWSKWSRHILYKCFTSKCYTWDKWDTSNWIPPIFRPPNGLAAKWDASNTTDIWHWFDCLWSLASLLWMSSSKVTWCHQHREGSICVLAQGNEGQTLANQWWSTQPHLPASCSILCRLEIGEQKLSEISANRV